MVNRKKQADGEIVFRRPRDDFRENMDKINAGVAKELAEQRSIDERASEAKLVGAHDRQVRRDARTAAEEVAKVELDKQRKLQKIRLSGRILWHGSETDFAAWIKEAYDKKWINAKTTTEAFKIASDHFSWKEGKGKDFVPRILQQVLNQRNNKEREKRQILSPIRYGNKVPGTK
jgi:hypothetical protein